MRRQLPSLASLQAFDAVARNKSFTRAATELGVTQAAMTQHVRNLEELLGVQLFVRSTGSVALTDAASGYWSTIQASLCDISVATSHLIGCGRRDVVTVDCPSAFAIKRLLPALDALRTEHQDISLHIRTMAQPKGKSRPDCDIAVWHGLGDWPGMKADKLFDEEIFPVCNPSLLASGPLRAPCDLQHHTVIRMNSDMLRDEWPFWLDAAGAAAVSFSNELACDHLLFSVQAAAAGLGVAIGRTGIVERDLRSGLLIEPFDLRLRSPAAYHLVTPQGRRETNKVALVRAWMLDHLRRPA